MKKLQSWRAIRSYWCSSVKCKKEELILQFLTRLKSASGSKSIKCDGIKSFRICLPRLFRVTDESRLWESWGLLTCTVVSAYLWHTGSTSPRWRGRWGDRSSWRRRGCCRSWCDGWGRRCLPPRSCPLCDRPPDSGCNASDDLDGKQRRGRLRESFFSPPSFWLFLTSSGNFTTDTQVM